MAVIPTSVQWFRRQIGGDLEQETGSAWIWFWRVSAGTTEYLQADQDTWSASYYEFPLAWDGDKWSRTTTLPQYTEVPICATARHEDLAGYDAQLGIVASRFVERACIVAEASVDDLEAVAVVTSIEGAAQVSVPVGAVPAQPLVATATITVRRGDAVIDHQEATASVAGAGD